MLSLVEVLCIKSTNLEEIVIEKIGKHILDNKIWNSKNFKNRLIHFQNFKLVANLPKYKRKMTFATNGNKNSIVK